MTDDTAASNPSQLTDYASTIGVPVESLRQFGLADTIYDGMPDVRISYFSPSGAPTATRFMLRLDGDDRFRWKQRSKPTPYGLSRIAAAKTRGEVVLVESEAECHVLWHHNVQALAMTDGWEEVRDAKHFDEIGKICVVTRPDRNQDSTKRWLSRSIIRHRAQLLTLDCVQLHRDAPEQFDANWQIKTLAALPWSAVEKETVDAEHVEAEQRCRELALKPDILQEFDAEIERVGLVGERKAARLLFLAIVSQDMRDPISVLIKASSSTGKSRVVDCVCKFFPKEAVYEFTAMSPRALVYATEPMSHRHLLFLEASGLHNNNVLYFIRTFISEGRISYQTVHMGRTVTIRKEGPIGVIVTTTLRNWHHENETRMLTVRMDESRQQTREVLLAIAHNRQFEPVELSRWHALKTWNRTAKSKTVVIPFAERLARQMADSDVRLRRDLTQVLALIEAHALLHRMTHKVDDQDRIIATRRDYAAVRELVADTIAVSAELRISQGVRAAVSAVKYLQSRHPNGVSQTLLREVLQLDKANVSRHVNDAIEAGYLRNLEHRRGLPARLVLGGCPICCTTTWETVCSF